MKRIAAILLTLLLLLAGATAAVGEIISKAQLNQPGMRVGVGTGSAAVMMVEQELPNADLVYLEGADGYEAVALGKIDAYVYDRRQMELAIASGRKGVHLLDEDMSATVSVAVGISPTSKIPDLERNINAFIAEIKANGTLEDMYRRWVTDSDLTMPDIAMPANPKLRIVVGTTGTVPPFSFYVGSRLNGYDIEMARRFAAWMDADVSFKVYDYGSIIIAAATGDVDLIMANLNVTPERAEALTFSDALYTVPVGIMVKGDPKPEATDGLTSLDQLDGKRIGVQTGTTAADITLERLPNAQISYFSTFPDMAVALKARKIDGFPGDGLVLKQMAHEDPSLKLLDEKLRSYDCGFVLPKDEKGEALCAEMNAWIKDMRERGELERILTKWTEAPEEERSVPDYKSLPAPKGTLTMTTEGTFPPMNYYRGDECVGMEIELCALFCEANGYGLNVTTMDFDGMLAAVQARKVDFAISGIAITEERKESVLFSDPYYTGGTMMAVLKDEGSQAATAGDTSRAPQYQSFSELGGKRVSMLTGAPFEELVRSRVPDVGEFSSFNNMPDMLLALRSNKTDAVLINNAIAALTVNRDPELALFPQSLQESAFGFAFAKGDPRRDEWQAAFDAIHEAQIQAAWDKWTGADERVKTLPDQDWSGENGTVRVAACDTLEPMSYVGEGGKLMGFDLEVILMIARELDVHVEFTGMEFSAILSSVQAGKADIGAGSIIITPERAESVDFVEYYPAAFILIVRAAQAAEGTQNGVTGFGDLEHATAAVTTGSINGEVAQAVLPDIKLEYFNNQTDCLTALRSGKVDFWPADEPVARYLMITNKDLRIAGNLDSSNMAALFAKSDAGQTLCEQYSAFVDGLWADGTMAEIDSIWFGTDEDQKTVLDFASLPDTNGTLRMATDTTQPPFSYVKDNRLVGYDVDIAARFCEAYGYRLEVVPMEFGGMLPAVKSGKCDFAAGCITITEERAKSVLFSSPIYHSGTVALVRKEAVAGSASADGVQSDIEASFHKTFIREERWKLFVRGIVTTLVITLLSILFGTLLGFIVFMLCRNGNPVANLITRFCMWLIQGMPMVVLLMILYYIIFGSVSINGIVVAVIGFTLTFGAAVFGLLKMGVSAVDGGQYEAAYALGYSNRRTFFRVILPQALPHVMPAYKGEIVGLIKATAIVGYIAVQDLTKMGDIVRSRTYEAFFPLIAVTIIYFVLEGLIGFAVSRIGVNLDPKRRKPEDILKGVKTDD